MTWDSFLNKSSNKHITVGKKKPSTCVPLNYKLHTRITLSMQMTNKYGEKGFPFWSPLVGLKLGSQMSFHTSKKKGGDTTHDKLDDDGWETKVLKSFL